jgi:hypothetical protein
MAKKPEPPQELTAWSAYKIAKKAMWLGRRSAGTTGRSANPMPFPRIPQGDIISDVAYTGAC